jgi:hypothetical protein
MRITLFITILLLTALTVLPSFAEENVEPEPREIPKYELNAPGISQEELIAIVDRSDAFFREQGIENIAVDLRLFRDPARVLTLDDLITGAVDSKAPFSPVIAHYFYQVPGWYQLKIMGILIASSEHGVSTYTHLLPLPGGQLDIPEVMEKYDLIYLGQGEMNGRPTHRVRFAAKDFKKVFIKYTIYEFDAEAGYLCRVNSHFDDGYWQGNGSGEFYYKERNGRMLPAYGYGEIYIMPFFKTALWGRWDNWEFNSPDFKNTLGRAKEEEFKPIDIDTN